MIAPVLAANARAGQETEGDKGGEAPGKARGERRDETDSHAKEPAPAQPVGQPTEDESPADSAHDVAAPLAPIWRESDQDHLRSPGERSHQGTSLPDLVEDPGDAERANDEPMKPAPRWEAIEASRDVGGEGGRVLPHPPDPSSPAPRTHRRSAP